MTILLASRALQSAVSQAPISARTCSPNCAPAIVATILRLSRRDMHYLIINPSLLVGFLSAAAGFLLGAVLARCINRRIYRLCHVRLRSKRAGWRRAAAAGGVTAVTNSIALCPSSLLRCAGSTSSCMNSTSRTARCGPVCLAVWEGRSGMLTAPIPITSAPISESEERTYREVINALEILIARR